MCEKVVVLYPFESIKKDQKREEGDII